VKTTKRTTLTKTTSDESTFLETIEDHLDGSVEAGRVLLARHAPRATPWTYLQTFFIEYPPRAGNEGVAQVKVFANGRQQVRIRVVLSPRNAAGEFVPIPAQELIGMVNLVDYNTGYLLPDGWVVHWEPNEYVYADWAISNAPGKSSEDYYTHDNHSRGALAADQIAVDYYVTSDRVASMRIAASISPPGVAQPIQTRPGASGNVFDSSVNIDARPALNLGPSSFALDTVGVPNNAFVCVNHFFTLNHEGRRIRLLRVEARTGSNYNIYVHNGESHGWEGVLTICSNGNPVGGTEFYFHDIPPKIDSMWVGNIVAGIQGFRDGAIQYVQHLWKNNAHLFWLDGTPAMDVISRDVYFVDEFGNFHRVRVGSATHDDFPWFSIVSNW
jgi:hypothetical protein